MPADIVFEDVALLFLYRESRSQQIKEIPPIAYVIEQTIRINKFFQQSSNYNARVTPSVWWLIPLVGLPM